MYFKLIIVSVIGLFSSRFIIQALGTSDYGLYAVLGSVVFMMAFLNNVMSTTTYRFIAFELGKNDIQKVNKVFNVSLVIHILIAIGALIIAETFGVYYINNFLKVAPNKLTDALFVFHVSVITAVVNILSVPYQGLLIAKEKFKISAFIEIVRSILGFGVVLLVLCYTGNKLRLYATLISIVTLIPSILYYIYSSKLFAQITAWSLQTNKLKYKEMSSFSGWVMFGAAAAASELQGAVLLLNIFFGTIINASFGIASTVNGMVKLFAQSLNQTVIPKITKSYSSNDKQRVIELVIFTSKYSFFLILIPSIPILLETDFILKLWIGMVPIYTATFVKLFIITAVISTMNAGIPAVVQASGKIKYFQIILGTMAIIGLPISYFLFKAGYLPYILAIVYLIIALLNLIILQFLLKRIIAFNIVEFFKKAYLKMLLVVLVLSPLYFLTIIIPTSFSRFLFISFVSVISLIVAVFNFGMSKNEKNMAKTFLGQKIFFLK